MPDANKQDSTSGGAEAKAVPSTSGRFRVTVDVHLYIEASASDATKARAILNQLGSVIDVLPDVSPLKNAEHADVHPIRIGVASKSSMSDMSALTQVEADTIVACHVQPAMMRQMAIRKARQQAP